VVVAPADFLSRRRQIGLAMTYFGSRRKAAPTITRFPDFNFTPWLAKHTRYARNGWDLARPARGMDVRGAVDVVVVDAFDDPLLQAARPRITTTNTIVTTRQRRTRECEHADPPETTVRTSRFGHEIVVRRGRQGRLWDWTYVSPSIREVSASRRA
jgi:hypothetical protein